MCHGRGESLRPRPVAELRGSGSLLAGLPEPDEPGLNSLQ